MSTLTLSTTAIPPTSFILPSSPHRKRHSTAFSTTCRPSINPFSHILPTISKDEIRGFRRPNSDTWMDLVHIMWAERQLHDLPQDDIRRDALQAELKRERISLRRKSCSPVGVVFEKGGSVASLEQGHQQPNDDEDDDSSGRVVDTIQARGDRTTITDLSAELRCMIYAIVLSIATRDNEGAENAGAPSFDATFAKSGLLALTTVFPELESEITSTAANLYSNSSLHFAFDQHYVSSAEQDAFEDEQDRSQSATENHDDEISRDDDGETDDMIGTASSMDNEAVSPRTLVPIITIPKDVDGDAGPERVNEIYTPTESLGFHSDRGFSEDGDDDRSSCYSADDAEDSGRIGSLCENGAQTGSIDDSHSIAQVDDIDNSDHSPTANPIANSHDSLKKHSTDSDRDSDIVKSWQQVPEARIPDTSIDTNLPGLEIPSSRNDTTGESSPASPGWSTASPSPSSRFSKRLSTISTMTTSSSYTNGNGNGEKPRKFVKAVRSLWRIGRGKDEVGVVKE